MIRRHADLFITAAVAVLSGAAIVTSAPVALTTPLGIALLAAPGYLLSQLMFGSRLIGLERLAVITVLAFCVPIFGGLLLYLARLPLNRVSWLGLLCGVTLVSDAVLFLRRRGQSPSTEREKGWHLRGRPMAAFGVAVAIAIGAVGLARAGAAMQRYPGFTQLWLAHPNGNARTANLGVSNYEGRRTQYRLILLHNGQPTTVWTFALANGQTWRRSPAFTGHFTITADLYRLPDSSRLYRHVTIPSDGHP